MTGFVVALVLVNLVHVAGQLLAARASGVRVDRLSLGMGPTVFEVVVRGTRLRVAALPLGLLVRLARPLEGKDAASWPPAGHDRTDYRNRSLGVRLAIVLAGPLAVLLMAYLGALAWLSLGTFGATRTVARVLPGSPAARAGVLAGDRLEKAAGRPLRAFSDLPETLERSGAAPLALEVLRQGQPVGLTVTPELQAGKPRIGVQFTEEVLPPPPVATRLVLAGQMVGLNLAARVRGLLAAFQPRAETMGGPLMLVRPDRPPGAGGEQLRTIVESVTRTSLALLFVVLSPLSGYLDGPKLLFLLIEAVIRRPLHPRHEQRYNAVTLALNALVFLVNGLLEVLR